MNNKNLVKKNNHESIKKKEDLEKELITLLLPISDLDLIIKDKEIKKGIKTISK